MIPVLYPPNATDFSTCGLSVLTDTVSCEVTEERNGVFECLLKYPVSGQHYGLITKECIIKAKPNDTAADQAFRIYRITKPLNGIVTIYGQHISYDLANVPVLPFATESRSPQLILSQLLAGDTRFTGWTDYSDAKPFSVIQPKSVRACLGGTEGSMLSQWHGEFEWDNFTVKFHSHRGQKTGVVIEYGKNLTALEQDEDNSGVYTALLPYAVYTPEGSDTETVVTLPEVTIPIVTSEIVRAKTLIMDFSDQFDGVVTEDTLRAKANSYIKANPLGAAIPTVKVSFEPLWKQPEYSALLERVNLCDTVTIRHSALGISVSAMVIETVYDTLAERYKSISLGQSKSSMITTISQVQSSVDKVESTVGRFPKLLQSAIGKATGLITWQSGGYVVIHTAEESGQPYELLILDAPSINDAVNVWRWNVGGLGFSHNGYNGPYETAITADGQIVADFITSGSLVANIIKAGVIQSQDGSSWWDLESGEVVLRAYATNKQVTEVSDRITNIEEQMYNPDNGSYTPDWKTKNLVLTPSLYVIGTTDDQITTANVTSVKWYVGDSNTAITADANYGLSGAKSHILTVKTNVMAELPGIDYRCVITYKDDSTGLSITHPLTITFSRVVNGSGIVDLLVTTPNGNVFKNEEVASLTAKAELWRGSTVDTTKVSYKWAVMDASVTAASSTGYDADFGIGWRKLSDTTGKYTGTATNTLTIYAAAVDSYAVFKCCAQDTDSASASYNTKFFDVATFIDNSDPLQIIVTSTGGDVFKNGQGTTVLTAVCYQAGSEVDAAGNGSYTWTKYNKDGVIDTAWGTNGSKTGKTLSVSSADVDTKATFMVVVAL